MRVLVTGAGGFVGRWMVGELLAAGHTLAAEPGARVNVTDDAALADLVRVARPEGVIHLAGIAYGPDAARDPAAAERVNVGGTEALLRALADVADASGPPAVVISGSSEVYGAPAAGDLPLSEDAPTIPTSPYGRSKLGQEAVGLAAARTGAATVAVTRSFNHTGPGQRDVFVAPALARRVLAARATGRPGIAVGNLDVRRDIGDVRDVARAYRLILEGLADGSVASGSVLNVATGRAVSIRELLAMIAAAAGVEVEPVTDPSLVRAGDPPLIVGDSRRLRAATGWEPAIPLARTLADLVASLDAPA